MKYKDPGTFSNQDFMVHASHLRVVLFFFVALLKQFACVQPPWTSSVTGSRRFVLRQIFRNQIIDAVVSTLFKVETTGMVRG